MNVYIFCIYIVIKFVFLVCGCFNGCRNEYMLNNVINYWRVFYIYIFRRV